ncbi:MAG: aminotransferase class V-fold PLP-dependent enzyme [Firmicutes bacterium]|nr:aminotransferase class V-fold PLP-dependent enzyme [Bacillota bacterium]
MIYLDNAATSGKKPTEVINANIEALTHYSINPNRSAYKRALDLSYKIYRVRASVADFFNADVERIIFTSGATAALNLSILGSLKVGGHIITSVYEHNSVLRVLEQLKQQGLIEYCVVEPSTKMGIISAKQVSEKLKSNTYMVALNHISNVTGVENDVSSVGKFCTSHNLLFLLDAAQSAGHVQIDIQKSGIDLLAVAGHKGLLGPQGVGVLALNKSLEAKGYSLTPISFGGTGTLGESLNQPQNLPEGFESGTLNNPGILALGAGAEYVKQNFLKFQSHIKSLAKHTLENLAHTTNVILYTPKNTYGGVISFNIKGLECNAVADMLDTEYGIAVRAGLHCAPLTHSFLDTLNFGGTVRASIGWHNTLAEINTFLHAVKTIANQIS